MRFLLANLLAALMSGSPTLAAEGPHEAPGVPGNIEGAEVPILQSVMQAPEVRVGGLEVATSAEPNSVGVASGGGDSMDRDVFAFLLQPTFLFSEEIACEGNITAELQAAVDAGKPFTIGPGKCTFDTIKLRNGTRFSGSGHPNTKLTYTGKGSTFWQYRGLPDGGACAFEPAKDRPMGGVFVAGFELLLDRQGQRNGFCGTFANGARLEDIFCHFGKSCVIWRKGPDTEGDPSEGFTQIFVNWFSRSQFGCTFDIRGSVLATFLHGDVGRNNGSPVVCYENARSDQANLTFVGYTWMGNAGRQTGKKAETMIELRNVDGLALTFTGGNYSGPESQNFVTVLSGQPGILVDNLNFTQNPRKPHFCAKVIDMPGRSVSCKDAHLSRIHVN